MANDIFDLGIGIEFPEGESVREDVDSISSAFASFGRQVEETEHIVAPFVESLARYTGEIQHMTSGALEGGFLGSATALEDVTQKAAVALGAGAERAFEMRSRILQLSAATQFGVDEIAALVTEMKSAGTGIDEFSTAARSDIIALNRIFQVSGDAIVPMSKSLDAFRMSLDGTLDFVTRFSQRFEIPGAFRALPEIVGTARDAIVEFGRAVVGSGREIVQNILETAGVFARTFGQTMQEAVQAATGTFQRFARALQTHRRVFLGLESDFDPLQQAFLEIGVGLGESASLIKKATSTNQGAILEFVTAVRRERDRLGDGLISQRFVEQLRSELPQSVMELIEVDERYQTALEQNARAMRRSALEADAGIQKFGDLAQAYLDTTTEVRTMWENAKTLTQALLVQTGVLDVMKSALRGAKDAVASLSGQLERGIAASGMRRSVVEASSGIESVGAVAVPATAAIGSLAATISGLPLAMKGISVAGAAVRPVGAKIGSTLGTVFGRSFVGRAARVTGRGLAGAFSRIGLGAALRGIGGRVLKAIPVIGTVISVFDGIVTAARDMAEVISDPNATGMEKFVAVVKGALKGVATAVDDMLLGIPGLIAGVLFPDMEQSFDQGFKNLTSGISGVDFRGALSAAWSSAKEWLSETASGISQFFVANLPSMREFGRSIGAFLGGAARFWFEALQFVVRDAVPEFFGWLARTLRDSFAQSTTTAVADGVEDAKPSVVDAMTGLGESMMVALGQAAVGIADGILNAFGTSLDEVSARWKLASASLRLSMVELGAGAGDLFVRLLRSLNNLIQSTFGADGLIGKSIGGLAAMFSRLGAEDIAANLRSAIEPLSSLTVTVDMAAAGLDLLRTNAVSAVTEASKNLAVVTAQNEAVRAWNTAVRRQRTSIEEVIQALQKQQSTVEEGEHAADVFARLDADRRRQAARQFSSYVDSTIGTLSKDIRAGKITVEDALSKLAEAKVDAVRTAIRGSEREIEAARRRQAADVASRAARREGIDERTIKAIIQALGQGVLAGGQEVRVTLRGAGAIEQHMARKSLVDKLKGGNR